MTATVEYEASYVGIKLLKGQVRIRYVGVDHTCMHFD